MLRGGAPEIVHGNAGDGADASPSWAGGDSPRSFGDCGGVGGGGGVGEDDNLSIELETLFAFLDSNQPDSPGIQDVPSIKQFPENVHLEKVSLPQDGISGANLAYPLEAEEFEHPPCVQSDNLDASHFKEGNGLMPSFEASGWLNGFNMYNQPSEDVKPYGFLPTDTCSNMSHAPSWLSLSSSGYENYLMDSVGSSIVPSVSGSFEYQLMQSQIPESLTSEISVYKSNHDSQCEDHANSIHFGCRSGQESVQGKCDSLLEVAVDSCKEKPSVSSSNRFQPSPGTDSSHFMSAETYSFGTVHDDVCTNTTLNTGRPEVNTRSTAVDSSKDLVSTSPNIFNVELRNGQATELTHCSLYNLPANMHSFPEGYGEAKNIAMQFLPGQLSESFMSSDWEHMINEEDKVGQHHAPSGIGKGNEVMACLKPGTFCDSFVDSDSSLSEMSCNGTNVEGMNLQCVSNADSLHVCQNYSNDDCRDLPYSSKISLSDSQPFIQNKKQKVDSENARKDQLYILSQEQCHLAKGVSQNLPKDLSEHSTNADEDPDVCIIDDTSDLNHPPYPTFSKKSRVVLPRCGFSDPFNSRATHSRLLADDEKLTYQIALQDLAQPKSEISPPAGVLAVPLLRHQRIALSWMVQKETSNLLCCGGILADDQGLGKTVSTLALILTERSPSSKSCTTPVKGELEALNLDEDDEFATSGGLKQGNSNMEMPGKSENAPVPRKGRPAAGTLVVCPTSVLRQWADELRNKVTSQANLSFLVYHGSNRTRDPYELVKYDVVLTTYSIVSLEVPMRSSVDKGDVAKGRPDAMGICVESSAGKKKKNSSRNLKDMNTMDSSLPESAARPLAGVGWFRVVLDEAQTIKNHRTQVARACWGLRAKRRWCLSGTPIQNTVDDLYSYFRFLRYDPYASYNSFSSIIKIPIARDPAVGYKKLQAVLRTIMLRRTKGTLLDGKPIINLPPKTIMLKKIDFSNEERAFYSRLEAESQEKFKGYADAGTVKQNYVNILLMLLRLRQACDHPLLVKGYDSSSIWRSSLEAAKKIPRDKQIELLRCLESCLALCAVCNDPPEDAVIAICGHVFCNQCISEHLTGDDNHCPAANCKVKLAGASVFSKATLKSSLSGLPVHECPEPIEMTYLLEANMSSDSSKIKAAVEILQSLPTHADSDSRSNYCTADNECTDSAKNACSTAPSICISNKHDKVHLNSAKCSDASVSEKAIVFSQWTRMLDLLEARLKSSSIQYRRLDGTMSVIARDKAVKDFNTLPEVTVMIMSLKAASLGLNMVAACHVLLLDLWWNPTTEDQAIDRAHRIGQTRPVTVSRLTVENTVEDRILSLQEKKREMVASAFGEDDSGSRQTRLTVEDLRYLFRV
uniref:Putative ATP-dependent helicase C23E6.02 n=1 Tax=Anthurium amnicola TaxID=1678845 RepID=A0A1D1YZL0_9ARAE